ncbi:tyrosine-type recombinase/integrase [Desulfosudis oleivorans]|uniref:Integrase family protein n=1 Tax=Desulfosudis oleivorans (strain DSM 6200 / JCM 39069 / Hxd3) TaxID=96561 RepID=A8ZYI4_DESOH|nr:site-specific integrase [Desulfosudis oleivorans]ABW68709.1 integrase family protein [Desulfosudis oleivorans Hxd3]
MSVYSVTGKGWRYDFTHMGTRYTEAWFKTKKEANQAEAEKRKEIKNPKPVLETPTDMAFLELVNQKLDHVKAYNSKSHYISYLYMARRWANLWGHLPCGELTGDMIQKHLYQRHKVSAYTANQDLRYLRAVFNFGVGQKMIYTDPTAGIRFFPVEKKIKYVPCSEDIDKVIAAADPDTQDYLWAIRETLGRVSEINRLVWEDINLDERFIILYTRKKRGGHLTPRKVPMTEKLHDVLQNRFNRRSPDVPWVFWHRFWNKRNGEFNIGPYKDRKRFMKSLCEKAGVRYFRFHALRHSGASIMDGNDVPIAAIQRILGHENRKTTEIYLHSMGDMERNAIAVFERARGKSHTDSHTTMG